MFENTNPPPDGARYVGQAAMRGFWEKWLAANPDARFEAEQTIISGDRGIVLWTYRRTRDGQPWHLRGVDVFKVRDGKVAEKLSYGQGLSQPLPTRRAFRTPSLAAPLRGM